VTWNFFKTNFVFVFVFVRRIPDESVQWCIVCKTSWPSGNLRRWPDNLECWAAEVHGNSKQHFGFRRHWPCHNFSHSVSSSSDSAPRASSVRDRWRHTCQCLVTSVSNRSEPTSRGPRRWPTRSRARWGIWVCSKVELFVWLRHRWFGCTWLPRGIEDLVPIWQLRTFRSRWFERNQKRWVRANADSRRPHILRQYLKKETKYNLNLLHFDYNHFWVSKLGTLSQEKILNFSCPTKIWKQLITLLNNIDA